MRKKSRLRLLINLLVLIITITSFGVVRAEENLFKDVVNYYPFNSWAAEIGEKYNLIFLENNTREAKRYEIAKILYYILDLKSSKTYSNFTDLVDLDNEIKEIINSVAEANIITGYENGEFRPNNNVTRAEFVSMLDRSGILKSKNNGSNISFSDIENHWAKESIIAVANIGIINGKGENLFCPDDSITPQEILVIMDRIVNIKCITEDKLISTMLNTFMCKQYTKEEQYLVEVIYNHYDEVLNFMEYAFPFKKDYDYTKGNDLITYDDIHYITYYMMSPYTQLSDGDSKVIFNDMGWTISTEKKSNSDYYTVYDLLNIILGLEVTSELEKIGMGSSYIANPSINYSNSNKFTDNETKILKRYIGSKRNTFLVDNEMYFPFDAPVTKYMFNYFIMNMCKTYDSYKINSCISEVTDSVNEFETDPSKMPYNYSEFPYIVKGVPLELYETPYATYTPYTYSPAECYGKYSTIMKKMVDYSYKYYNLILNVDYRTIEEESFKNEIEKLISRPPIGEIEEYVQYVRDNEIILEGEGVIIPGTQMLINGFFYTKAIVKFKVVSAKKMENLVFGDMYHGLFKDVQYMQNEYNLHPAVQIVGIPSNLNGKLTVMYKLNHQTLLEGIKGMYGDYKLP